jgi:hypothetical protein
MALPVSRSPARLLQNQAVSECGFAAGVGGQILQFVIEVAADSPDGIDEPIRLGEVNAGEMFRVAPEFPFLLHAEEDRLPGDW